MRTAIISDIHGNRTAFEAVLADLRTTSPDLILHGGDLADSGSSPVEIVDQIRDFGWPGVVGNTDEMLTTPSSLEDFAKASPHLQNLFATIREMADSTREALGEERLAWLRNLPLQRIVTPIALVHASPRSSWHAPKLDATGEELESLYGTLGEAIVVHGHVHRPYLRQVAGMAIVNTGSVGLSYDGDKRASYLLLDDSEPKIRRVEYDVEKEAATLLGSNLPHAQWVVNMLRGASFQMPQA